jgi:hypothetical protein
MNSSDNNLLANALPISETIPRDPEKLNPFLDMHFRRISNAVNGKESALYLLQEQASFKSYFTTNDPLKFRNVYRFVMDVVDEQGGNLSPGTYTFPHGITGISAPTFLSGTATTTEATPRYLPLPYVDATAVANQIQLHATSTNIVVIVGATAPTLSQCYVVFEYTKN